MAKRGLALTIDEYFIAKRELNAFLGFSTYFATTYSAFMLVGLVGYAYLYGVGTLGFELMYLLGTLALLSTIGVSIYRLGKRLNAITPTQLVYEVYNAVVFRHLTPFLYIAFLIPYMSIQLIGPALILKAYGLPYVAGVLLMALVVYAYTAISGFRGVSYTDALQGLLFLATSIALAICLSPYLDKGLKHHPELLGLPGGMDFWTPEKFVFMTIPWMFFALSNPQVLQRIYAVKSIGAYKRMVISFAIAGLIYTALMVLIGLEARGLFEIGELPRVDPNLVTPTILRYVNPILAALTVVSIVAAAKSTLDSILLTLSSCMSIDVLKGRGGIWAARGVVAVILGLSIYFALARYGPVVRLAVESSSALLTLVPIFVMAAMGVRLSGRTIDVALIAGLVLYVTLRALWAHIHMPFTLSGIISAIAVALILLAGKR